MLFSTPIGPNSGPFSLLLARRTWGGQCVFLEFRVFAA